ncbi:hypothetical protein N7603_02795 [Acholeplasma vituli]|jgi:hypothetical protein|uniref:Uncharacterized protein n=1 Tax=Paracholeplasma vituli TaxID=69473 RepID=A0ABT2PUF1_9MOLU|nr:hypothetical protein [Paracholeplasma vituli]MCU0104578.1 hypothetical protein [Paracholeplasma vituli]
MNVRDKLRNIGFRLNELTIYLDISRPTLYKYLELFEKQEFDSIDKKTYDLFKYIESTRGITKPILTDYLFNQYVKESKEDKPDELIEKISILLKSKKKLDKSKIELIKRIIEVENIDDLEKGMN